jgi:hypothetical protein
VREASGRGLASALGASAEAVGVAGAGGALAAPPLEMHVLLPASGDLRHVIKTINGLPLGQQDGPAASAPGRPLKLHVHLNDHHPKIALRNLMVLQLLGSYGPDAADAAAAIIYSTALTSSQYVALLDCSVRVLSATELECDAAAAAERLPQGCRDQLLAGRGFGKGGGGGGEEQGSSVDALTDRLGQVQVEQQGAITSGAGGSGLSEGQPVDFGELANSSEAYPVRWV